MNWNKLPVITILALAAAAHFVPVLGAGPRRYYGWELAHEMVKALYFIPKQVITTREVELTQVQAFLICLSIPAFWTGVAALFLPKRISQRLAGRIAAYAGVFCLVAAVGFVPPRLREEELPGCFVWLSSIVLLSVTGFWTARRSGQGTPALGASHP